MFNLWAVQVQLKAHRTAFFLYRYDNDTVLFIQRTP